jgi:hypothetical protein
VTEPASNPVFVVGAFRSGTSLLYSLLNLHPQVGLMYECDIWNFPRKFSRLRFERNWLERQEFYNQALSRHRLIFGGGLAGLENTRTPEDLYRNYCDGKGAARWGEKSPLYCARLQQLARRYPGGSFILLWRDPIEIYRSMVVAGSNERFFRRQGMLSRLIHDQEQMIRQANELNHPGARVYHVTYVELVDQTEKVCRDLCGFLKIEFDPKMIDLNNADFSAVYHAPQHNHLRRRRIERRTFPQGIIEEKALKKLERFRTRWSRLNRHWFDNQNSTAPEPGLVERVYHQVAGSFLGRLDEAKRALFEFLPLTWLRTYRQTIKWFFVRHEEPPVEQPTLREQFANHWVTILVSCLMFILVAGIDFLTGPNVVLGPFYLIPCAGLTLILNRRWGTAAAALCALLLTALRVSWHTAPPHLGLLLWNMAMRFLFYQIVVLLLDRVRIEIASADNERVDSRMNVARNGSQATEPAAK